MAVSAWWFTGGPEIVMYIDFVVKKQTCTVVAFAPAVSGSVFFLEVQIICGDSVETFYWWGQCRDYLFVGTV